MCVCVCVSASVFESVCVYVRACVFNPGVFWSWQHHLSCECARESINRCCFATWLHVGIVFLMSDGAWLHDRLASLALSSQELARRSACWNDDAGRNPKSGGEGGNSGDAAADIEDSLRGLAMPGRRRGRVADIVLPWRTTDMEREWEGQLVVSTSRRLHEMAQTLRAARAYAPPAQASPVQLACSRREFGRRQEVAMGDLWARRLLLGGFEAGECPLVWGNELSCVSSVPFSLQRCNVAPCPAWPSMMTVCDAVHVRGSCLLGWVSRLVPVDVGVRVLVCVASHENDACRRVRSAV